MPDKQKDKQQPCIRPATEESLKSWAKLMNGAKLPRKLALVALEVGMMGDPEDGLAAFVNTTTGKVKQAFLKQLEKWEQDNFTSLVKDVADLTGADPEQIANPKTRTQEQQQALLEASARRQLARLDMFYNSDYMRALRALYAVKGIFDEADHQGEEENSRIIKEPFLMYYFSTRPDIRPSTTGKFTDADQAEMIEQYKRFEAFLVNRFGDTAKAEEAINNNFLSALKAFLTQENPSEAEEIIEHLTSVLPEKYVIPNNKLANTITKDIIGIGSITLEESRKGAKKPVITSCILTYEGDNVKLSGRQTFTEYDRNVYNAVSSLYLYGNQTHIFTPAMVYRAMTGLTDTEKPPAGQLESLTRSLDKMRFIRAQIDCTDELKARRIRINSQQINHGIIDTYLLAADAIKLEAGGEIVDGYHVIKPPIMLEYSATVKQVVTIPASTLDVKEISEVIVDGKKTVSIGKRLPNTEARILIKGYLIRRIEGMRGRNGLTNPIIALYDYEKDGEKHQGLCSIAGKSNPTRTEANRIRSDAEKMLTYWQATGYITAYQTQTENRRITGYKITV